MTSPTCPSCGRSTATVLAQRKGSEDLPDDVAQTVVIYKCECGCLFKQVTPAAPPASAPGKVPSPPSDNAEEDIRSTQAWPIPEVSVPGPGAAASAGSEVPAPALKMQPLPLASGPVKGNCEGARPNEFWLALHELVQAREAEGGTGSERDVNILKTFELMPAAVQQQVLVYLLQSLTFLQDIYSSALDRTQIDPTQVQGPHFGRKHA